ncbi:MAG: hypothetical protein ACTIIT_13525, partial [Brevibacterium linens]
MTRLGLRVRAWWAALTAVLLVAAGGAIVLPAAPVQAAPIDAQQSAPTATAQAASGDLSCEPGVVYSVSGSGQLWRIAGGQPTEVGSPAKSVKNFNGLGIGDKGSPIYAIERNYTTAWLRTYESGATVHQFNASTETWSSTGASVSVTGISFIAGAVDFSTGNYYFGGYSNYGRTFELYVFDSSTRKISKKGTVRTSKNSSSSSNGDMSFDAEGNLYIVRGVEDATTVFRVGKDALAGSGNQAFQPAVSGPFATSNKVNGVAFDADGAAYLGSSTDVMAFDMPDWSNKRTFSGDSGDGTDLSSCSTPATIKLVKNVQGGRAKADDQFELSLKQGATSLGTAVTTGNLPGLQDRSDEEVVQLPTKRGAVLNFSETGVGQTDLADYESQHSCTVDGKPLSSGSGKSGTVTIPSASVGDAVVCTITNAPLTANVSIHKDVVDENGANKKPGQGWT